jgi:hypothetical protein
MGRLYVCKTKHFVQVEEKRREEKMKLGSKEQILYIGLPPPPCHVFFAAEINFGETCLGCGTAASITAATHRATHRASIWSALDISTPKRQPQSRFATLRIQ